VLAGKVILGDQQAELWSANTQAKRSQLALVPD